MKKFLLLVISAGIIAVIINCSSDIVLPEPEDITGQYVGWYAYRDPVLFDTQAVTFEFECLDADQPRYRIDIDTTSEDLDTAFCICVGFGNFAITDRLDMREKTFGSYGDKDNLHCGTCDNKTIIDGLFSINRIGDTLKLTRQTTDTLWQLILLRVGDCEIIE